MSRELVKNATILCFGVAGLAAAAWFMTLREAHRRLGEVAQKLAEQELTLASTPPLPPDAEQQVATLTEKIERTSTLISMTPATSDFYAFLQELARQSGLRVDRMEPSGAIHRNTDTVRTSGYRIESSGYELNVSGSFAEIVGFMRQIERRIGLGRATSFRVQTKPASEGDVITAEITVMVYVPTPAEPPQPTRSGS